MLGRSKLQFCCILGEVFFQHAQEAERALVSTDISCYTVVTHRWGRVFERQADNSVGESILVSAV